MIMAEKDRSHSKAYSRHYITFGTVKTEPIASPRGTPANAGVLGTEHALGTNKSREIPNQLRAMPTVCYHLRN